MDDLISGKTPTFRLRHRYASNPAWESPSTQLPLLLLRVMEGGRMCREEVSFLQADCWMERRRNRQMTMAGRLGPECRLRESCTLLHVGSGRYAKCTELRPSQRIWQGDPFTHPHPSPASRSLLSSSSLRWHPTRRWWLDAEWRQVWERYLHHYHFCIFFCGSLIIYAVVLGNSTTEDLI